MRNTDPHSYSVSPLFQLLKNSFLMFPVTKGFFFIFQCLSWATSMFRASYIAATIVGTGWVVVLLVFDRNGPPFSAQWVDKFNFWKRAFWCFRWMKVFLLFPLPFMSYINFPASYVTATIFVTGRIVAVLAFDVCKPQLPLS